jgi:hypothetical protein
MADDFAALPVRFRTANDAADLGTETNPIRTDPTGVTDQPVSQGNPAAVANAWPITLNFSGTTAQVLSSAPASDTPAIAVRNIPSGVQQISGTVSTDSYVDPQVYYDTKADLAASVAWTFNATAVAAGKTGYLGQVCASSAVPLKIEVQTVVGGVVTTVRVGFTTGANPDWCWEPPSKELVTAASDGDDNFRVIITNKDNNKAADVYVSVLWDEITTA